MDRSRVKARDVASRVPLDYYKKPDPVFKRKIMLAGGAAVAAGVWVLTMFAPGKTPVVGANRFSHGTICKAHASFGHECSACHTNFPIFGGPKDKDGFYAGDARCKECHLGGKGDTHAAMQKANMTPNCGVCHTDHKGADFAIKRVNDNHCNTCHKDLSNSVTGGAVTFENEVTSFADKHPPFKNLKEDPGKIKFNHKYHTTDGVVLSQGGKPFKVKDMADGPLKSGLLARGQSLDAAVRLDCADCHKEDNSDPLARTEPVPDLLTAEGKKKNEEFFEWRQKARGWVDGKYLRPPHTPGAYMAPIKYDNHCAACHPLTFDANLPAVKHNQQPDELRKQVTALLEGTKPTKPANAPLFGLPGKPREFNLGDRVEAAMRSLMEGKRVCGECHVDASGSDLTGSSKKIATPNIPNEWFLHARFQHRPHDFMSCRDCHPQAYAYGTDKAWDGAGVLQAYGKARKGAEDVMIPNIDNCRQCHVPGAKPPVALPQTARHDCAECHGYHHGKPR